LLAQAKSGCLKNQWQAIQPLVYQLFLVAMAAIAVIIWGSTNVPR
jgi:hypothetical protein